MITITKAQRKALKRKYDQNPDGSPSYRDFRKRVLPDMMYHYNDLVMINWCGMWLGIESDGYTHS